MLKNEMAVGINVYSPRWHELALLLQRKGKHVVAGDFSNFDGTLNNQILFEIVNIVNDWYDDGEENALIRKVLWREIVASMHICGDNVYAWNHSQPSGNPATVIINSIYNSLSLRIVWNMLMKDTPYYGMAQYEEHVSPVTFGDDNVLNISDEALEFFNQETLATGFAKIGMTYINETKDDNIVLYRTLDQVSFLKRKFAFDMERRMYRAPLDLAVIMEMVNWIRGTLGIEEATITNCETAFMELALHPKPVFDVNSKLITKACFSSLKSQALCLSFNEYQDLDYTSYFSF
jgi:hypothetical protein